MDKCIWLCMCVCIHRYVCISYTHIYTDTHIEARYDEHTHTAQHDTHHILNVLPKMIIVAIEEGSCTEVLFIFTAVQEATSSNLVTQSV